MTDQEMSLRSAQSSKVVELSQLKKGNIILVSTKDPKSPTGFETERATVEEADPTGRALLVRYDKSQYCPSFLTPSDETIVVLLA